MTTIETWVKKNTLFWAAKKDILLIQLFYVITNFTQCHLFSHQFISTLHGNISQHLVNIKSKLELLVVLNMPYYIFIMHLALIWLNAQIS